MYQLQAREKDDAERGTELFQKDELNFKGSFQVLRITWVAKLDILQGSQEKRKQKKRRTMDDNETKFLFIHPDYHSSLRVDSFSSVKVMCIACFSFIGKFPHILDTLPVQTRRFHMGPLNLIILKKPFKRFRNSLAILIKL